MLSSLVKVLLVNGLSAMDVVPMRLRWLVLRIYGVRIARARVSPGCFFGSSRVSIAPGAFVNREVFFDGLDHIVVGPGVHIGMQTLLLTGGHAIGGTARRAGTPQSGPVVLEEGCWLGARVVVMPGVTIGRGAVIAAGSLVTSSCEADSLYAGSPARRVRVLAD